MFLGMKLPNVLSESKQNISIHHEMAQWEDETLAHCLSELSRRSPRHGVPLRERVDWRRRPPTSTAHADTADERRTAATFRSCSQPTTLPDNTVLQLWVRLDLLHVTAFLFPDRRRQTHQNARSPTSAPNIPTTALSASASRAEAISPCGGVDGGGGGEDFLAVCRSLRIFVASAPCSRSSSFTRCSNWQGARLFAAKPSHIAHLSRENLSEKDLQQEKLALKRSGRLAIIELCRHQGLLGWLQRLGPRVSQNASFPSFTSARVAANIRLEYLTGASSALYT